MTRLIGMQKDSWRKKRRRHNIDRFIERVADNVRSYALVKFGVSPLGFGAPVAGPSRSNSAVEQTAYDVLHADVRKWLQPMDRLRSSSALLEHPTPSRQLRAVAVVGRQ